MKKSRICFFISMFLCFLSMSAVNSAVQSPCQKGYCSSFIFPARLPASWDCASEIEECSNPQQLLTFLNKKNCNNQDSVDELRMLVATSYAHGKQLLDVLINIVGFYDKHVLLWQKIRQDPVWYRLKQGPWRWLGKTGPKKEIEKYLGPLKKLRNHYAACLGRLNTALNNVNSVFAGGSQDELESVLSDLVFTIRSIVDLEKLPKTNICDQRRSVMKNLYLSLSFEKKAKTPCYKIGLPGHFRRNLIPYTLGCASTCIAGLYFLYKKDELPIWRDKFVENAKHFYSGHVDSKLKSVKRTLWGDSSIADYNKKVGRDNDIIRGELVLKTKDLLKNAYPKKKDIEIKKIVNDAWSGNGFESLRKEAENVFDKQLRGLNLIWHPLQFVESLLGKLQAYSLKLDLSREIGMHGMEVVSKHASNSELAITMAAVGVPLVCLYYGYSWITSKAKQYKKLRDVLVRLRISIDKTGFNGMLSDACDGMQIYLLNELKKRCYTIPRKDRERFKADLDFLSSRISDTQKFQRIDSMIGPYAFNKV